MGARNNSSTLILRAFEPNASPYLLDEQQQQQLLRMLFNLARGELGGCVLLPRLVERASARVVVVDIM